MSITCSSSGGTSQASLGILCVCYINWPHQGLTLVQPTDITHKIHSQKPYVEYRDVWWCVVICILKSHGHFSRQISLLFHKWETVLDIHFNCCFIAGTNYRGTVSCILLHLCAFKHENSKFYCVVKFTCSYQNIAIL
jgi:hypothetical protein